MHPCPVDVGDLGALQCLGEGLPELLDAAVALLGAFAQRDGHHPPHVLRQIRPQLAEVRRILMHDLVEQRGDAGGGKGRRAGEHLEDQRAHAVDVAAHVHVLGLLLGLLWGHVARRAHQRVGAGQH